MIEKREWRRMHVELDAAGKYDGSSFPARIVNVNQQGFCFASDNLYKSGDKIEFTLQLETLGQARLLTEVTWSGFFEKDKRHKTGVRIISTDQAEREKFIKFYNLKLLTAKKQTE